MEKKTEFVECLECIYREDCPVMWHHNNAACLTIQKKDD